MEKRNTTTNKWENNDSNIIVYIKQLRSFFPYIYLLTYLNKDTQVLLKVLNI